MTTCEQLGHFMDGELPEAEAEAYRGHLVDCLKCQDDLKVFMLLDGVAEKVSPRGAPGTVLGPQNFACLRDGCGYRFPENELAGGWCPKCGGRVEPLPRTVITFAPGYSSSPRR